MKIILNKIRIKNLYIGNTVYLQLLATSLENNFRIFCLIANNCKSLLSDQNEHYIYLECFQFYRTITPPRTFHVIAKNCKSLLSDQHKHYTYPLLECFSVLLHYRTTPDLTLIHQYRLIAKNRNPLLHNQYEQECLSVHPTITSLHTWLNFTSIV